MSDAVSVVLCLLPVVLLILMMVLPRGVPSHIALPSMAFLLYLIKLVYHEEDPSLIHATVVEGILTSFTPIVIIWGAVLLFKTMDYCDSMRVINQWLHSITTNRVAQLMIVSWSFAFLIEGASGFGTPAALAGPLLVGMGFPAEKSALLCLVMNSVPVIFGAVGMPTWFGLGQLGLTEDQLMEIAVKSAAINSVIGLVVPLIALRFVVSTEDLFHNILYIYASLMCTLLPFFTLALFNYEFPAIIGGIIGLLGSVVLAKYDIGLDNFPHTKLPTVNFSWQLQFWKTSSLQDAKMTSGAVMPTLDMMDSSSYSKLPTTSHKSMEMQCVVEVTKGIEEDSHDSEDTRDEFTQTELVPLNEEAILQNDEEQQMGQIHLPSNEEKIQFVTLLKASFPLWGTALTLLITRIDQLEIKGLLTAETPSLDIELGSLGVFKISPAIVVQLTGIFGTTVNWRHQVLYVPSILPFLLISCITFLLYRMERSVIKKTFKEAFMRITKPLIVLFGALVLVRLFMAGGDDSCSLTLGRSLGNVMGAAWKFFGFFLGALGSFFSGSATVSNLMFAPIQQAIAEAEGINLTTMLALQSCGASMGNMVAISNIIAVSTVLGISGKEGWVLKRSIIPLLVAGLIAMIMAAML